MASKKRTYKGRIINCQCGEKCGRQFRAPIAVRREAKELGHKLISFDHAKINCDDKSIVEEHDNFVVVRC